MEKEYIFIYGVFRDYANILLDDGIYCDRAFVHGKIYKVGEFYPGFVRDQSDNRVFGDVYLIDPSIFPKLDEFEGDEYNRTKIYTSIGEECWVYEYRYSVGDFKEIPGGDWILR